MSLLYESSRRKQVSERFFEALQQLNTNLSNQAIESDSSAQEFINAGS
jgi:hypothetical protein